MNTEGQAVLIGIIGREKDLDILLKKKWYRIPVANMPRRRFSWLAFYHTSKLSRLGKKIQYYAKVEPERVQRLARRELLPDEPRHARADDSYYKFCFSTIRKLRRPIRNSTGMRMVFGFTTLPRLLKFKSLPNLFGVRPLERIFRKLLKKNDIPFMAEYSIMSRHKIRYRLDLAIFCKKGKINVECDSPKFHSGRRHTYDLKRNRFLQRRGWRVRRFSDEEILLDPGGCVAALNHLVKKLGGLICSCPIHRANM